jgi:hypothetical protein
VQYWPDGAGGVVRDGNTYMFWFPGAGGYPVRSIGTLDNPVANGITVQSIGNPKQGLNYMAGGDVYPYAGSLWFMMYHGERWALGNPGVFHGVLGVAYSTDRGNSWRDLGLVVTHNTDFPANSTNGADTRDIGMGTAFHHQDAGVDYLYCYFSNALGNVGWNYAYLSVARCSLSELVAAAMSNSTPQFVKYNNGWNQPGLGGWSSPLDPQNRPLMGPSVAYSAYRQRPVMVSTDVGGLPMTVVYLEGDPSGLQWGGNLTTVDNGEYPTIIGMGADPHVLDQNCYAYYLVSSAGGVNRWADGYFARRQITLMPA